MSAFQSQLSSGIDQAMGQTGVMITYMPINGSPYQILAVMENRGYVVDQGGVMIASDMQNVLVRSADMPQPPEARDQILVTQGSTTQTLTVMQPDATKNCWESADRYLIRRRIHTKVTSST